MENTETAKPEKMSRQNLLFFGTGILWGIAMTLFAGIFFLRANLIQEKKSALSYEEAVRLFPQKVATVEGWTVRTVPCGLPAPVPGGRITVFEICSRKYAGRILEDPSSRKTAAVLPCKIAIYERDGKVYFARLNGSVFMRLLGGVPADVFAKGVLPEQKKMFDGLIEK